MSLEHAIEVATDIAAGGGTIVNVGCVAGLVGTPYGGIYAASKHAVEAISGPLAAPAGNIEAPGMLASHYAPRARLRLDAAAPREGEAYLAFGTEAPPGGLTLSARGDVVEAAANLYAHLRALDATGAACIAVAPIPAHGLGEAISDRLARAAAPRG